MIRHLSLLTLSALAVLTTSMAQAQTVLYSELPAYGTDTIEAPYLAESFQLTQSATLGSIVWWGNSSRTPGDPGSDQFSIQLYPDSGMGSPNTTPLTTLSFSTPTITDTGQTDPSQGKGAYDIYQYSAKLNTPISLPGGLPLYIQITDTNSSDNWGWQVESIGMGFNWNRTATMDPWIMTPGELAFELLSPGPPAPATPEPSTVALIASSGLSALGLLARKRRRK